MCAILPVHPCSKYAVMKKPWFQVNSPESRFLEAPRFLGFWRLRRWNLTVLSHSYVWGVPTWLGVTTEPSYSGCRETPLPHLIDINTLSTEALTLCDNCILPRFSVKRCFSPQENFTDLKHQESVYMKGKIKMGTFLLSLTSTFWVGILSVLQWGWGGELGWAERRCFCWVTLWFPREGYWGSRLGGSLNQMPRRQAS